MIPNAPWHPWPELSLRSIGALWLVLVCIPLLSVQVARQEQAHTPTLTSQHAHLEQVDRIARVACVARTGAAQVGVHVLILDLGESRTKRTSKDRDRRQGSRVGTDEQQCEAKELRGLGITYVCLGSSELALGFGKEGPIEAAFLPFLLCSFCGWKLIFRLVSEAGAGLIEPRTVAIA